MNVCLKFKIQAKWNCKRVTADCSLQFAVSHEKLMLKVFLIPMDVLQQEIISLTMKYPKIKGYSKQDLNFKDFPLTQLRFNSFSYLYELCIICGITKQCENEIISFLTFL